MSVSCMLLGQTVDEIIYGVGGLTDGVAALRQLAKLRLQNILTEPLTDAVSEVTKLTSLSLHSDAFHLDDDVDLPMLPGAAAALTGLRLLDIDDHVLPPAVKALTGMLAATSASLGNLRYRLCV